MRITMLQWSVGMFCTVIGAMMLVVPHRFEAASYAGLQPHLLWWGVAFLLAGGGLLAAAVHVSPRRLVAFTHLSAGGLLLTMARGFASEGLSARPMDYVIVGLGTALAPLLCFRGVRAVTDAGRDLLSLLLGLVAAFTGVVIFASPEQFSAPFYDVIRIGLPWYGVALTITGLTLVYCQFRPAPPRAVAWAVYLSAAVAFVGFAAKTTLPAGDWVGVAFFGGFGVLLAILPWLDPALQRVHPTSLRTRLALALVVAVAVPLIAAVSLVTARSGRSATTQGLALQETIAITVAGDISRYVAFHRAAAAALARAIILAQMTPVQQEALLRTLGEEYPDVATFATYDDRGRPIARGDSHPHASIRGSAVFERALRTNAPALVVDVSPISHRLVLEFGAPLRGPDNAWAGLLVLSVETARVAAALDKVETTAGAVAYLVDGRGRVLVQQDAGLRASLQDVSNSPSVAALLSTKNADGVVRYAGQKGEQLAGYAHVAGVGWGVVVERPLAAALTGSRGGRELAFMILLLMMGGAAVGGVIAASVLARPLEALAREAQRLGEQNAPAALPDSSIAEVKDLSAMFAEMSTRLAARTQERAAAEESLRRQNAYLSALHETALGLIRRLDLKDLLEAIVTRAGELVDTPNGTLYLVNQDTNELEPVIAIGSSSLLKPTRLKLGEGVGGRVWASGEPLVIDDYDLWPGRLPGIPLGLHHGVAGIPLKSGAQTLGVMILRYAEPGRTFGPEALELLSRFAHLAALALDNARLLGTLEEREARIRSIMDSTSDGFVYIGRDGQMKSVSRRATELLPHGGALQAGRDFAGVLAEIDFRPTQRDAVIAALRSFLEGGTPTGRGDLEWQGSNRVLQWEAQPARDDHGDAVGLTLTLHDVTQERDVSRMKSDFVSFVTHQLRTPLAGIKWLLELAAGTEDAGEIQEYIRDARDANERLVNLVNDLLDISRLESGRLVVSPRELDLGEMTRNVLDELTPLIKDKGHRLSVDGAEAVPPVLADPQLLRQVVMNLVSNAIKYTPSPGEIALRMRPEDGAVQWAIRDTGIGVPKDALPRLFEKFYRADNVHKIETEGTGLGLYLVRLIVERFGGRIWCESEEGKGSTFLFTVPLSGGQKT